MFAMCLRERDGISGVWSNKIPTPHRNIIKG